MLSNILQQSSKFHSKRTLIEYHDKRITYEEAHMYTKQHQKWMERLINEESQSQIGSKGRTNDVEIVIAYLSYNTPDLLLSILGSIGFGAGDSDGDCTNKTRVRVAMLNARWSAMEIAQALRIHPSGGSKGSTGSAGGSDVQNNNRKEHITFIIYGKDMSQIAKEACLIMNNTNLKKKQHKQNKQHNNVIAMALAFSLPTLTLESPSSSIVANNNLNSSTHNTNTNNNNNNEAIILFTSGTTSGPKGVKLGHKAMFLQAVAKIRKPCSYDEKTRMLATTVPFFHVGGLSSALAIMIVGGCLVFPKQISFSFDPKLVLQSIQNDGDHDGNNGNNSNKHNENNHSVDGVDTLVIVPAMLHTILNEIESQNQKQQYENIYKGVRLLLIGGQSLTESQIKKAQIIFPNARIVQTYACTEAASSMTFARIDNNESNDSNRNDKDDTHNSNCRTSTSNSSSVTLKGIYVGKAPPHVQLGVFILKDDKPTLQKAPPYVIGAIGTKGPHIMNGYWKRGSDDDEGSGIGIIQQWLITNDLGYMDNNGRLYFCGRLNDVIRTGGETVFAPEVEAIIIKLPNVDECAVFALPDERFGECVCVAIVKKQINSDVNNQSHLVNGGSDNLSENIREICERQKLSSFKRPRRVFLVNALPRNSSGKVLKNELKRIFSRISNMQSKL